MDKQTSYILMAMATFCILFFLYILSNHKSRDEYQIKNIEGLDISSKKKFDLLYDNYKAKYYSTIKKNNIFSSPIYNSLVSIDVYPRYTEPNVNKNFNFTISWKTTNTSLAEFSWIGIYPYAQKTDIFNCLNYFYLKKELVGTNKLPIPEFAGYYDIRYIQDNNKKTLSTFGPILVNPQDSFIKITNGQEDIGNYDLNEKISGLGNQDLLIEEKINNVIDLKFSKNFDIYEKINIQWKISGKTLEKLLKTIYGDNKDTIKNMNEDLITSINPKNQINKNPKSHKNVGEGELSNGENRILTENYSKSNTLLKSSKRVGLAEADKTQDFNSKTKKFNIYLCLTILGSSDSNECIWKKRLESMDALSGKESVEAPTFAGYFYFRIFLEKDSDFYESVDKNIVVGEIYKMSSDKFILLPESLESVVGSYLAVNWFSAEPKKGDWIGLYNLGDIQAFIQSLSPIKYVKINENNSFYGNFSAFLPTNKEAGQFIFIYFRDHKPISITDLIEVQQPRVTCPIPTIKKSERKDILSNILPFDAIKTPMQNNKNKKLRKNLKFTQSNIKHLVIICTENHSFDSYFGEYCESPAFSNPKCNYGAKCCEKPPKKVDGYLPVKLNDTQNLKFDPNHNQYCELCEINNGKMNGFVKGCSCSDPQNFAVADKKTVQLLHEYARNFSLADMFFQPAAGASAQNDMYFARASHVFIDNRKIGMGSFGSNCWYHVHFLLDEYQVYYDPTITALLSHCNFTLRTYAEGYEIAKKNFTGNPCYPLGYDASDIPFNYYAGIEDKQNFITDYKQLKEDIKNKTLPEVSFIKPLGIRSAHPGFSNITDEMIFVKETVDIFLNSEYYDDTLIIYIPDESGGYYDHIPPPETIQVDNIPYGPRIPVLAIGKFAKKNYISHVEMEHSSIIKFIEWNWLSGETGQLNVRDKNVNGIGDLIDPEKAGVIVP